MTYQPLERVMQELKSILLCAPFLEAPDKFFGPSRECRLAQGLFKRLKYYKKEIPTQSTRN
jgi:hypothetical protein